MTVDVDAEFLSLKFTTSVIQNLLGSIDTIYMFLTIVILYCCSAFHCMKSMFMIKGKEAKKEWRQPDTEFLKIEVESFHLLKFRLYLFMQ